MGKRVYYNSMGLAQLRTQIQLWEGRLYDAIRSGIDAEIRRANTRLNHLYRKEDEILYPEKDLVVSK